MSVMEIIGQCALCGKPANDTCTICGRLACDEHFYPQARMCSHCIPVTERRKGDHQKGFPPVFG